MDVRNVYTVSGGLNSAQNSNSAQTFEDALSLTGFGKFHWMLILTTGLVFLSSGYQSGLAAYVIPAAQCDLQMTSQDKGLLNAVFLIGGISSAFFWGVLADHVGRRKVIVISLVIDAIITFISSFSQSFRILALFRFLNGFVIGAPGSLICTYLGELVGERQRARSMCCMGIFFTVSWMILPAVAMAVLPLTWNIQTGGFIFNSWRLFILIAFLPSLLSALLLSFFPESPKFLYSKGRELEAIQVMETIFNSNNSASNLIFPVKSIIRDSVEGAHPRRSLILDAEEVARLSKAAKGSKTMVIIEGVWRQLTCLCKPPLLGVALVSTTLVFCNMFGYYGLGLWLPELFDRFEEHYSNSNHSVTVCELTRLRADASLWNSNSSTPSDINQQFCRQAAISPKVYVNTFIIGSACLLVNLICILLTNLIGLKFLAVVTTLIASVCAAAIYFLHSSTENLIFACLFLSMIGAANIILNSAICDLFPTKIRAVAVCAAMFAGRTGAVASNLTLGYVLDSVCEVPVFLMAATLLVGALLAIFLPGKNANKTHPS